MKRLSFAMFLLVATVASAQNHDFLKVTSYKLDNGMTVWINEDHTTPTAYGAVVVRAGAKDCPSTGIAHYFEHMMFKGTDKFGTVDYASEKPYLDSIASMYDKLALAKEEEERTGIQKEINRLSIAASKYVIPNEFDALTTLCGGSGLNAYTSQDETVFHSGFLPQFFEQWAEINSERLMNPVFRLFQSELETVYEEKNMYSDNSIRSAVDKFSEIFFAGTPYQYSVIGTTENLKNPQLSKMREFFEKYYVAGNMGLILCGDFDTETVKPVIEKTFGRIRSGEEIKREAFHTQPLKGRQERKILIDIPVVKIEAMCYRTPVAGEPGYNELEVIINMLQNNEGVGMLDRLAVDRKIMEAGALNMTYQMAGGTIFLIIPKLVGQSIRSAEAEVTKVLDDLRKGNFEDSFLESCKKSYKKMALTSLEDKESRVVYSMANIMSRGESWEDELERIEKIDAITKDDIMKAANRFFNEDCLVFIKKTGSEPKDNLRKPPYDQVVPESKDCTSAYAAAMKEAVSKIDVKLPEVVFDKEVRTVQVSPMVRLFASPNPINDVFNLKIQFLTGTLSNPAYEHMTSYINSLGTSGMTYEQLNSRLQELGGGMGVSEGTNTITVSISGLDENIEETMKVACGIFKDLKADKKKLAIIKDEDATALNMQKKDISEIARALINYAAYGENSSYLADKGKLDSDYLLGLWKDVQKNQCDVLYTGNVDPERVSSLIKEYVDVDAVTVATDYPLERKLTPATDQKVLFIDKPGSAQTIVTAIIKTGELESRLVRDRASIYDSYLGGGMTSLMFQEIREFRSMAYSAGSGLYMSSWKNREKDGCYLIAQAGTQNDKATDAMQVIDSLLRDLPVKPAKFEQKKTEYINELFYEYPSFRGLPAYVQANILNGRNKDVSLEIAGNVEKMSEADLKELSESLFEDAQIVWCVVGNSKKLDMEGLKAFGPVTVLKVKDVMK